MCVTLSDSELDRNEAAQKVQFQIAKLKYLIEFDCGARARFRFESATD